MISAKPYPPCEVPHTGFNSRFPPARQPVGAEFSARPCGPPHCHGYDTTPGPSPVASELPEVGDQEKGMQQQIIGAFLCYQHDASW